MNAAFMGERIFANDGFVARNGIACNRGEEFRGGVNALRLNPSFDVVSIPVSTLKKSLRVRSAMTTSSRAQLPARSARQCR